MNLSRVEFAVKLAITVALGSVSLMLTSAAAPVFYDNPPKFELSKDPGKSLNCSLERIGTGPYNYTGVAFVGDNISCTVNYAGNYSKAEININSYQNDSLRTVRLNSSNETKNFTFEFAIKNSGINWLEINLIDKFSSSDSDQSKSEQNASDIEKTSKNHTNRTDCSGEIVNGTCHIKVKIHQGIGVQTSVSGQVTKPLSEDGSYFTSFHAHTSEGIFHQKKESTENKRHYFKLMGTIAVLGFLIGIVGYLNLAKLLIGRIKEESPKEIEFK